MRDEKIIDPQFGAGIKIKEQRGTPLADEGHLPRIGRIKAFCIANLAIVIVGMKDLTFVDPKNLAALTDIAAQCRWGGDEHSHQPSRWGVPSSCWCA